MFIIYPIVLLLGFGYFYTNPKESKNRWLLLALFVCAEGGLLGYFVIQVFGTPMLPNEYYTFSNLMSYLLYVLDTFSYYFFPYTWLMFSISYAFQVNPYFTRNKYKIYFVFLIPIIVFYIIFPIFPENNTNFFVIVIWAGIYVLISDYLIMSVFLKCKNRQERVEALIICLSVIPGLSISFYTDYALVAFGSYSFLHYQTVYAFCMFTIIIFIGYKYGALEIKLRFKRKDMDTSMRSAFLGVTIINHSIKNEIAKISMCADLIDLNNQINNTEISKSVEIIQNSVDHLSSVMHKVRENVKEITISEGEVIFDTIVESAVNLQIILIKERKIEIIRNYNKNTVLLCDKVHIIEVLNNLFLNSIEAMDIGGKITISSGVRNRLFYIKLEDTGKGIPKSEISNVLSPFYTTKTEGVNFGLGLSYCYSVMKKHKGTLEISSKESYGTSVCLYFPLNKVKYIKANS